MARKRLIIGSVLEVVLDDEGNKGYMVYVARHDPLKFKMFGLYAIRPRKESYTVEELEKQNYVATIMIFEDSEWEITGKLKLKEKFAWPDQYVRGVINDGEIYDDKLQIYHFGDGGNKRKIKQINLGEDVGSAQPGVVFFPFSALRYYRKRLREEGLYDVPEKPEEPPKPMSEEEEMEFAGIYGDVYFYYKKQIEKGKEAKIAVKNTLKKFKAELITPDTDLQVYMGIAKAQVEQKEVLTDIKEATEKKMKEEWEYLEAEKWLGEQAEKLKTNLQG